MIENIDLSNFKDKVYLSITEGIRKKYSTIVYWKNSGYEMPKDGEFEK